MSPEMPTNASKTKAPSSSSANQRSKTDASVSANSQKRQQHKYAPYTTSPPAAAAAAGAAASSSSKANTQATTAPQGQDAGYRIVVSNLNSSITTAEDIKQLFEEIDGMLESRMVHRGVAEVIYENLDAAKKAVETYHNKQLDGQLMMCLLVNPATAASSRRARARKPESEIDIDIDTVHKVLFRRK